VYSDSGRIKRYCHAARHVRAPAGHARGGKIGVFSAGSNSSICDTGAAVKDRHRAQMFFALHCCSASRKLDPVSLPVRLAQVAPNFTHDRYSRNLLFVNAMTESHYLRFFRQLVFHQPQRDRLLISSSIRIDCSFAPPCNGPFKAAHALVTAA